jgi:DNA helicase-2/ATP-dependent DNA helicase PcrA
MQVTSRRYFKFNWGNYRYDKKIVPFKNKDILNPAIVNLYEKAVGDEWSEEILKFIIELKSRNRI